jgi:hypothetical protein
MPVIVNEFEALPDAPRPEAGAKTTPSAALQPAPPPAPRPAERSATERAVRWLAVRSTRVRAC